MVSKMEMMMELLTDLLKELYLEKVMAETKVYRTELMMAFVKESLKEMMMV